MAVTTRTHRDTPPDHTDDPGCAPCARSAARHNVAGNDLLAGRPHVLTVAEAVELRDVGSAAEAEGLARRLRARWVAEALEEAANEWGPGVLDDSGRPITATLRSLAAEYRDGER
jgi:hypothetical protein